MKAVDTHLLTLLRKSNQFIVPIYQRLYSWQEPECEQLWTDILRAGSNPALGAHFTGSIVYVTQGAANIVASEPHLIIDGQQRVTTVTILLSALADHLTSLPDTEREPVDGFSPNKIRNRFLLNADEDDERRFKLLLTQADKAALLALVKGAPIPTDTVSRVAENDQWFRDKLADPTLDLVALCRGLDKLVVVDVKLETGVDNPQLVFEAMNSTGKRLSQADLIRNFVLMDLPTKQQTDLYTDYWRPMELEFLGAAESQFDEFVRHYLTVRTGDIPRLRDIYEAFKDYSVLQQSAGEDVSDLVVEMREYARRYCALALGKEKNPRLSVVFKDLGEIKADVVYPLLLEVYTDYDAGMLSVDEFVRIVRVVTSYVFRRAVCRRPTNSLNKTFAGLAQGIDKSNYVVSVEANLVGLKSYRAFPTDAEFRVALVTGDLYNFRRRSYFFRQLENFGKKEHVTVENYTIEHILPQNESLSKEWRLTLGEHWREVQEKYLHTLGNLTLTGYNSEYSDHSFQKKRDMPGGFKESPVGLNAGLGQLEAWGEDEVVARADRLSAHALTIWARPQVSDVEVAAARSHRRRPGYGIEDHPLLLPQTRRALFEKFSEEVLALDPGISREFLKLYVAFKAETNIVDVVPQRARLRLSLNIPIESLHDEQGLAWDVSDKGHWGNGPTEVGLSETSDMGYIVGLVRQALEAQLGDSAD